MIIVITTAITYTTFSMNQITQLAETIGIKQTNDVERASEEFQVVRIATNNNKFNMTVQNTGNTPVHINRLWIENTTDSTWPVAKYDLDVTLASGNTTKNIGQNLDLYSLDTQSYQMQIISERGNAKELILNAVGESSLYLRLTATPAVMPTTFHSTVTLEIINTGTTHLANLQPTMLSSTPVCNACTLTEIGTVSPSTIESLKPGDSAFFEWVYSFEGENQDQALFIAGLVNDVRSDTFTVTLQTIESALNADVAVESGGLGDQELLGKDVLIFHAETADVHGSTDYQMYSGAPDGDSDGTKVSLDSTTPHFITNNGSLPVTIPAGNWDLALQMKSDPVNDDVDSGWDMIFHFEDEILGDPDNSQDDDDRDLEACGNSDLQRHIVTGTDDAEQRVTGDRMKTNDGGELELAEYGSGANQDNIVGLRYQNISILEGTLINNAYLNFYIDKDDGNTTYLRIWGELSPNSPTFVNDATNNISDRTKTTAFVDWTISTYWDDNNPRTSASITPNLAIIVQEIINQSQWESGEAMVFIIEKMPGQNGDDREAEKYEDGGENNSTILDINFSAAGHPDWEETAGPHNSGVFKFDGSTQCFVSKNPVTSSDENNIGSGHTSTSLWFKTDGQTDNNGDEYLFDWTTPGETCPACEFYRLYLTDGEGKLVFEHSPNSDLGVTSLKCTSDAELDDGNWHHVAVTKEGRGGSNQDTCTMRVTSLEGVLEEDHSEGAVLSEENIQVDGEYWHIGANTDEDGNFFKGWIDDFIHFDDSELDDPEMDALAYTNYGVAASMFAVKIDVTDRNGDNPVTVFDSTLSPHSAAFADPKCISSCDDDDTAYTQTNMTLNFINPVTVLQGERMDVYFAWDDGSTNSLWTPLEVDMKIDDSSMSPYPSLMQIPEPDNAFPTYYVYDTDNPFRIFVANTGVDGIFFTYQGTRVNFNGTGGSFATLIDSVNGTGSPWTLDEDRDSKYIPAGELAELFFYDHPTDIPSKDLDGNEIPSGLYSTTVWANGYSDQGETFTRSIVVGSVEVTNDPGEN